MKIKRIIKLIFNLDNGYINLFNREIGYYGWRDCTVPSIRMKFGVSLMRKEICFRIYRVNKPFINLFKVITGVRLDLLKEPDIEYEIRNYLEKIDLIKVDYNKGVPKITKKHDEPQK